jgi:hypothetical protein
MMLSHICANCKNFRIRRRTHFVCGYLETLFVSCYHYEVCMIAGQLQSHCTTDTRACTCDYRYATIYSEIHTFLR